MRLSQWLTLIQCALSRYSVMDFIVCHVHRWIGVQDVVYSYDISCQWSRNHQKRVENIPSRFKGLFEGARVLLKKTREYLVPKFHLYAHKVECWLRYNFSFTPGVGQTDGEGCERVWAGANPAASSFREMGPGSMRDALDALCASWNHSKNCGMSECYGEHIGTKRANPCRSEDDLRPHQSRAARG